MLNVANHATIIHNHRITARREALLNAFLRIAFCQGGTAKKRRMMKYKNFKVETDSDSIFYVEN